MVSAGDFRNGLTIEIDGTVYQVIEFQHVKPGKGAAFVRTKLKNVVDGGVVEKTFRHRRILIKRKCSICTTMVRCTTSWIMKHMSRLH